MLLVIKVQDVFSWVLVRHHGCMNRVDCFRTKVKLSQDFKEMRLLSYCIASHSSASRQNAHYNSFLMNALG